VEVGEAMARSPDPLRIVEAAYRWDVDERLWLGHVLEAAAPFSAGGGLVAFTLRCDAKAGVDARSIVGAGVAPEVLAAITSFCGGLRAEAAPLMFAPTEFAGNAAWRLARIARGLGLSVDDVSSRRGLPPMWAILAGASDDRALCIGFLPADAGSTSAETAFPNGYGRVLGLVGAHLGVALRVRELGGVGLEDPSTEAVLSPSGRVLHATNDAKPGRMRSSLTEAVVRSERARGKLRRSAPEEATELWSALVEGRWSILDTCDADGRRFLLARRVRPAATDLVALTKEENEVVWLSVRGHSTKYIAYELGISRATVVRRLQRAMKKLRVGSRRELLVRLGGLVA